jgi:hypothetical protein
MAVLSTGTLGTHQLLPAEPHPEIKVQAGKGYRMFLTSVIEPHAPMAAINSRSFRYAGARS